MGAMAALTGMVMLNGSPASLKVSGPLTGGDANVPAAVNITVDAGFAPATCARVSGAVKHTPAAATRLKKTIRPFVGFMSCLSVNLLYRSLTRWNHLFQASVRPRK